MHIVTIDCADEDYSQRRADLRRPASGKVAGEEGHGKQSGNREKQVCWVGALEPEEHA